MTMTMTRPAAPPAALPTMAEEVCGWCHGTRGQWEYTDGQTPGKSIRRWVACQGCKGTGKVQK